MFFRRKKSQGFDWHAYVRTTIALRRAQRKAKVEEIGRVAANQAKAAGGAAAQGVLNAANTGWRASVAAWSATVAQPAIALPLSLCGVAALGSGLYKWSIAGPTQDALVPSVLGAVLLLAVAPLMIRAFKGQQFQLPAPSMGATAKVVSSVAPLAAVGALVLALGWFAWGQAPVGGPSQASAVPGSNVSGVANVLEGKPTALAGDMLRLNGRLLSLSGIEAPERQQTCAREGKPGWKCGEAAQQALERLARAKSFRCVTQGGPDAQGRTGASCTADGRDVAAELVKGGHVFSTATYFGGYASAESEARRAAAGIWGGPVERPAEYRSKLWGTAKGTAPNGCPIKAQISNAQRIYLMPWSADYGRTNVRADRGERWFCSEAEANAAGFRLKDAVVAGR